MKRWFLVATVLALTVAGTVAVGAQQQPAEQARLRAVHAAPGAPPVAVLVNGNRLFCDLNYTEVTRYSPLVPGSYSLAVAAASGPATTITPMARATATTMMTGTVTTGTPVGGAAAAGTPMAGTPTGGAGTTVPMTGTVTTGTPMGGAAAAGTPMVGAPTAGAGTTVPMTGTVTMTGTPMAGVTTTSTAMAGTPTGAGTTGTPMAGATTTTAATTGTLAAGATTTGTSAAGTPSAAAERVLVQTNVSLNPNASYSAVVVGTMPNLQTLLLTDDLNAPPAGQAKVRLVHASPNAPAVDVAVKGGQSLFTNVAYKGASNYQTLGAGTYDLEVRPTGSSNVVVTVPGVTLESGVVYTIYAVGLVNDQPPLQALLTVESVAGQPVPSGGAVGG